MKHHENDGWQPPPITNPFHSGRMRQTVVCPVCQRTYRPWHGNKGTYCTPQCNGRARSLGIQAERLERLWPLDNEKEKRDILAELEEFLERVARDERLTEEVETDEWN